MNLQLPSLIMLNLDWTCVTEASSLEYLRENGKVMFQDTNSIIMLSFNYKFKQRQKLFLRAI